MPGAELNIDQQIAFLDSVLWFDAERNQILNPFLGCSTESLLASIRKSLVELKTLKDKKEV